MILATLALALLGGEPAFAAPAQGATSLAHTDEDGAMVALAGDTALFDRQDAEGAGVFAVPVDASARAQSRLHIDAAVDDTPLVFLSGSAQRAAIATVKGDETGSHFIGQLFSGPPAGPWPALTPPLKGTPGVFFPIVPQLDGDALFVLEARGDADAFRETVREGGGPPRAIDTVPDAATPAFAGDMEARIVGEDEHTLLIRNWRTGAQVRSVDLGDGAQSVGVRPDGTAVVGFDGGGVVRVAPDGALSVVARSGERPQFAGDRIVYVDGERLMVVDPGAQPRPVGVPSASIGAFDADDRHVVWTANGCVLVADLAAPAADSPDAGVCARTEFELDPHANNVRIRPDRSVRVHVRCVAAPGQCTGTLRVSIAGRRGPPLPFSIPARGRATLAPRLPRSALKHRGWRVLSARAVVADPDGRHTVVARGFNARVR